MTDRPTLVAPSLLASDFGHLADEVAAMERAGASLLHLDVMDGQFVPNISFGSPVIRAVRKLTRLPLQTHLMIEQPERYIEAFQEAGSDEIVVHAEACVHLHRTVQQIHAVGARAGVALNPHTPLDTLEWIKADLDIVLLMTVNPGFGGQKFIGEMLPKIRAARELLGPRVDIVVDGGVDAETAPPCLAEGANVLVAGTSIFAHRDGPEAGARAMIAVAADR
jgi:ribulose-phosphate 3-epimerase